jgi:hypothetical protein
VFYQSEIFYVFLECAAYAGHSAIVTKLLKIVVEKGLLSNNALRQLLSTVDFILKRYPTNRAEQQTGVVDVRLARYHDIRNLLNVELTAEMFNEQFWSLHRDQLNQSYIKLLQTEVFTMLLLLYHSSRT